MRLDPPLSPIHPVVNGTRGRPADQTPQPVPVVSCNSTAEAPPPNRGVPRAAATAVHARVHPLAIAPPLPHGARLPRRGGRASVAHAETRWYVVIRGLEVGVFNGW